MADAGQAGPPARQVLVTAEREKVAATGSGGADMQPVAGRSFWDAVHWNMVDVFSSVEPRCPRAHPPA